MKHPPFCNLLSLFNIMFTNYYLTECLGKYYYYYFTVGDPEVHDRLGKLPKVSDGGRIKPGLTKLKVGSSKNDHRFPKGQGAFPLGLPWPCLVLLQEGAPPWAILDSRLPGTQVGLSLSLPYLTIPVPESKPSPFALCSSFDMVVPALSNPTSSGPGRGSEPW